MHSIGRLAALAGSLLVAFVANRAHGQNHGERLAPLYEFRDLVADLRAAEVHPPPERLVEAYRTATDRWLAEQGGLRTSLERIVGSDLRVHVGKKDMERAAAVIRRSRAVAAAVEEGLFNELAELVPAEEAPRLATVREWRRLERANPGGAGVAFLEFKDVARAVRQTSMSDESRRAALSAIQGSSGARREALARLQRSSEDSLVNAGAVIDELGVAGQIVEQDADSVKLRPYFAAMRPDADALADAYDAELAALDVACAALPPAERRAVFGEVTRGFLAEQIRHLAFALPARPLGPKSPADVARILLSWKELEASKRPATRDALRAWIDEDEAAVRAGLGRYAKSLHDADAANSNSAVERELLETRIEIARRHIPIVAEASGADWMTGDPNARPMCDEATLAADDFKITGTIRVRPAPAPDAEIRGLASQLLPMSFDSEWRDRIVAALSADDPSVRDLVDQLLKDHAAEWTLRVEPLVKDAQAADVIANSYQPADEHGKDLAAERIADAIVAADAARRHAFEEAAAVDASFFAALGAALGENRAALITALAAARSIHQQTAMFYRCATRAVSPGFERFGGEPVNLALVLFDDRVPTDVRDAAALAARDRWQPFLDRAAKTLRACMAQEYLNRPARHNTAFLSAQIVLAPPTLAPDDDPRFAGADLEALISAWGSLVDEARAQEDALEPVLVDAVGDDEERAALRIAIQRARFPAAHANLALFERLVADASRLAEFEERPAMLEELTRVSESLATIARRRADESLPRMSCVGMTRGALRSAMGSRGWRGLDLLMAELSLMGAGSWLVLERVPAPVLAESPRLKRMVQSWANLY